MIDQISEQSPIIEINSSFTRLGLDVRTGNDPYNSSNKQIETTPLTNETVAQEESEEKNYELQILGGWNGRKVHEVVKNMIRSFTGKPENPALSVKLNTRIHRWMRNSRFDDFPELKHRTPQERKQIKRNITEADRAMFQQLETTLNNPDFVYFSEWKQKPSSIAVAEFGQWWHDEDNQAAAAECFHLSADKFQDLTYSLLQRFPQTASEIVTSQQSSDLSESANSVIRLFQEIGLDQSYIGSIALKSETALYQDLPENKKKYITGLLHLRHCARTSREISQYLGGATSVIDRILPNDAKVSNFLKDENNSQNPQLNPNEIRGQIEDAVGLFTPEDDIDPEAMTTQFLEEAKNPELRSRRERLLAPPWVVPDLIKLDISKAGEAGKNAAKMLRQYIKEEQRRHYPGKNEKVAHPNFFHNPETFHLIDEITKDGGTLSIIDFKTSLFDPGSPDKYKEKMGFQLMALTQWLISMRRQEQPDYTIFNVLDDNIFKAFTGVDIVYLNAHLNRDDITAEPPQGQKPEITQASLWQETSILRDVIERTSNDADRRKLIKQLFNPFLEIQRKYVRLLDVKRRNVSS